MDFETPPATPRRTNIALEFTEDSDRQLMEFEFEALFDFESNNATPVTPGKFMGGSGALIFRKKKS